MWQEYTKELYKKDLHDSDNHDGEITPLEPDIACETMGLQSQRPLSEFNFLNTFTFLR